MAKPGGLEIHRVREHLLVAYLKAVFLSLTLTVTLTPQSCGRGRC